MTTIAAESSTSNGGQGSDRRVLLTERLEELQEETADTTSTDFEQRIQSQNARTKSVSDLIMMLDVMVRDNGYNKATVDVLYATADIFLIKLVMSFKISALVNDIIAQDPTFLADARQTGGDIYELSKNQKFTNKNGAGMQSIKALLPM